MNSEVITAIIAIGSLATAAATYLDARTKALNADKKAKAITDARLISKQDRDEQIQKLQIRMAVVEKDCELLHSLDEKVDRMNDTLIEIKTLIGNFNKEKKD